MPRSRAHTAADGRLSLYNTIGKLLVGSTPERVADLQIEPLLAQSHLWDNIVKLAHALRVIVKRQEPYWSAWRVEDAIRLLILNGRQGDVIACGPEKDKPENDEPVDPTSTRYLVLTPEGLDYHPPITKEAIEAARALYGRVSDSFACA